MPKFRCAGRRKLAKRPKYPINIQNRPKPTLIFDDNRKFGSAERKGHTPLVLYFSRDFPPTVQTYVRVGCANISWNSSRSFAIVLRYWTIRRNRTDIILCGQINNVLCCFSKCQSAVRHKRLFVCCYTCSLYSNSNVLWNLENQPIESVCARWLKGLHKETLSVSVSY